MKQIKIKKMMIAVIISLLGVLCSVITFSDENTVLLNNFTFEDDVFIELGETYQIELTLSPSNADMSGLWTYTSSDLSIAAVNKSNGLVSACSPGQAIIYITYTDERNNIEINKQMTVNVVFKRSEAALPYEPDKWNTASLVGNRNCYTYAFNYYIQIEGVLKNTENDHFYTPGDISDSNNARKTSIVVSAVRKAEYASEFVEAVKNDIKYLGISTSTSDALIEVGLNDAVPEKRYKVVLFLTYDSNWQDFHWYRQNKDGTWSHKQGSSEVTNLDEDQKIIYNPITCKKNKDFNYEYVGCYAVKSWN